MINPQSLYIHVPFCEQICDYCDFTKLQYFRLLAEKYLVSLKKELDNLAIKSKLKTIYIGGGTPTALEDDLFEQLLQIVEPYSVGIVEYTVEANPESLSIKKLNLMKEYGVNRLSIGVESTNDNILKSIHRNHTFADVQKAIIDARKTGFDNINVDLILGLPHVSNELLIQDVANVLSLKTDHISCYSLTVHPNTLFHINGISPASQDNEREMYELVEKELLKNGFEHYEISNWAKQGKESLHNLTYWRDEQYYAAGPGAAGYIGKTRYINTKSITEYIKGNYRYEEEIVELSDDKTYFVMLTLRTKYGLSLKEYENRFHENFYIINKDIIDKFVSEKILCLSEDGLRIYPTFEGMMILDTVLMQLL